MHDDAVRTGQRVLIVDDLLATGGTAKATSDLVRRLGGEVHALAFLIELVALNAGASSWASASTRFCSTECNCFLPRPSSAPR